MRSQIRDFILTLTQDWDEIDYIGYTFLAVLLTILLITELTI